MFGIWLAVSLPKCGSCEGELQTGGEANHIVQLPVPVNLDTSKTLLLTGGELGIILKSIEAAEAVHLSNCCLKVGQGSFSSKVP